MSTAPLPTQLVLLSSLPQEPSGSKVRFLGWYLDPPPYPIAYHHRVTISSSVQAYHIPTATLTLSYDHITHLTPETATAKVDVRLLLNSLRAIDTAVGEWVNVLGYVTSGNASSGGLQRGGSARSMMVVDVQAIMIWSAGAVRVGEYEEAVKARLRSR